VYAVLGSCASVAGDNPLCEGLGNVERRIIADRESSVDISLWTSYMILDYAERGQTLGTSIFLMGMYRLGISDNAFRTVYSLANATIPAKSP